MARTLNANTVRSMMALDGTVVAVWIAKITNIGMTEVYRICDNIEDIIGPDGETYTGIGFEFIPAEDSEDGFKTARINLNNVEQWFTEKIRALRNSFLIEFSLVTGTNLSLSPPVFGNTEISILPMSLIEVTYDSKSITGTLSYHQIEDRVFPKDKFTPDDFPGLF